MEFSRIVVLVRPEDSFGTTPYMLKALIEVWQSQGREVLIHAGTSGAPTADLAILHVDLTVTPEPYLALSRTYPRALNARVVDISKERISRALVRRGDGYAGPVIVKTNANAAGLMEAKSAMKAGGWRRVAQSVRRRLPWWLRAELADYPNFATATEVPRAVWFNRDLVVERFQPEREGEFYCLRTWVFFGDRETHAISYAPCPVVKASRVVRREELGEVPPELREMRLQLGFDYGKFDYVVVEGRIVLYDVNRTPGGATMNPLMKGRFATLAEGLGAFSSGARDKLQQP